MSLVSGKCVSVTFRPYPWNPKQVEMSQMPGPQFCSLDARAILCASVCHIIAIVQ